jgi:O-6-methylguanine DNA methyltransferase
VKPAFYCLFETPIGICGFGWREAPDSAFAVSHFQLPEASPQLTESRLARFCGAAERSEPSAEALAVKNKVVQHLSGELQDFRTVPVELDGVGQFVRKVCSAIREIPAGQTVTYAELATSLGEPDAARAVGRALGRNPIPLIIPCHRVQAAGGKPGGFSAPGGRVTKAKLLAIEGAVVNLCLDFAAS